MKLHISFCLLALALVVNSRGETTWKAPPTAAEGKAPFSAEPKVVSGGRAIYEDRCLDCHGKAGKGDGPGASDLEKAPTNFRDGKSLKQTDGELFWKITEGHRPMPSYKRKLSDEQRWQLVHYIRTFEKQ